MVESSNEPSLFDRVVSACTAHTSRKPSGADAQHPTLLFPKNTISRDADSSSRSPNDNTSSVSYNATASTETTNHNVADDTVSTLPPPAPPPIGNGHRETSSAIDLEQKPSVAVRFYLVLKEILLSSWLNVLLIFVPVGIAVKAAGVSPTIVFAINAIAIVPLAGLLSHATESVASEMGDTIGALMNVTFGNAVELIILFVYQSPFAKIWLTVT